MRKLKGYEINLLNMGNDCEFAHLFLELYPEIAKKNGIDLERVVNSRKSFVSYADGIFTVYGKVEKLRFNAQMQLVGGNQY